MAPAGVTAAQIQERGLQLSDNRPGAVSEYRISMNIPSGGTLGSVKVEFCSNLALLYYPCTPPPGFDVSSAAVVAESGISGFSVHPSTTANELVLTRTPAAFAGGLITITLNNVTNQNFEGSSFARYYTYATDDASGAVTDDGAVAYDIREDFGVSAEVPPYLTMCVATTIANPDCTSASGNFVQLGEFSTRRASLGVSQAAIATNAANGYTLRIAGLGMVSGNNVLPSLSASSSSRPGTSQFGINVRANSNPSGGANPDGAGSGSAAPAYGAANIFRFNSGEVIAGHFTADDYRRYTISYLVNISQAQPAGVYSGTFAYIALGNF